MAPLSSTFCLLLSPCKITELKSTGASAGTMVSPGANDWTRETDPIRRFCSSSESWSVHANLLSRSFIIDVKRNRTKMFPLLEPDGTVSACDDKRLAQCLVSAIRFARPISTRPRRRSHVDAVAQVTLWDARRRRAPGQGLREGKALTHQSRKWPAEPK